MTVLIQIAEDRTIRNCNVQWLRRSLDVGTRYFFCNVAWRKTHLGEYIPDTGRSRGNRENRCNNAGESDGPRDFTYCVSFAPAMQATWQLTDIIPRRIQNACPFASISCLDCLDRYTTIVTQMGQKCLKTSETNGIEHFPLNFRPGWASFLPFRLLANCGKRIGTAIPGMPIHAPFRTFSTHFQKIWALSDIRSRQVTLNKNFFDCTMAAFFLGINMELTRLDNASVGT